MSRRLIDSRLAILREDLIARLMFVAPEMTRPWFEAEAGRLMTIAEGWQLLDYARAQLQEMRELLGPDGSG
ncbi:MAG TPA: hypothetical protein VHL61_10895 [Luteimonas sp.]|jgi:hypothetical protein|nr:hypothetical protein [Luteimonas sp.]